MRRKDYQREEEKTLEWLRRYMKIEEIDDKEFREAIFYALTIQNQARRFEIHVSDLIYCLRASWAHKVIPQEYGKDQYKMLFHWLRGKGIEIGITEALANLLKKVGKTKDIEVQKEVIIGQASGHVDLQMFDVPYEIGTRLFFGSKKYPRKDPPSDKVIQNVSYMAAQDKHGGRVKIYVMVPPVEYETIESPFGTPMKRKLRRTDRTWQISLYKDGLIYFKKLFQSRSNILNSSLNTGEWWQLPTAFFAWRCDGCPICNYLENHRAEVHEHWINWFEAKSAFDKTKFKALVEMAKDEV